MSDITLLEAMEIIDNCLTEKETDINSFIMQDLSNDDLKMDKDYSKRERNISLVKTGVNAAGTALIAAALPKLKKELSGIKDEINKEKAKKDPDNDKIKKLKKKSAKIKLQMAGLGTAGAISLGNTNDKAKWAHIYNRDVKEIDEELKRRESNVKESVDDIRLRCYESCEAGYITEEERDVYLDYLDLDNYTESSLSKDKYMNIITPFKVANKSVTIHTHNGNPDIEYIEDNLDIIKKHVAEVTNVYSKILDYAGKKHYEYIKMRCEDKGDDYSKKYSSLLKDKSGKTGLTLEAVNFMVSSASKDPDLSNPNFEFVYRSPIMDDDMHWAFVYYGRNKKTGKPYFDCQIDG